MQDTTEATQKAREFALEAHGDQMYGVKPYIYHLDAVVEILGSYDLPEFYIVAGYLHDILEDTEVSPFKIFELFGRDVYDAVVAITDDVGPNRYHRKKNVWYRIRRNYIAYTVKLADRLVNWSENPSNQMYINEYPIFRAGLWGEYSNYPGVFDMWLKLDHLYDQH